MDHHRKQTDIWHKHPGGQPCLLPSLSLVYETKAQGKPKTSLGWGTGVVTVEVLWLWGDGSAGTVFAK